MKAKAGKPYITTRDMYKTVKKFDRTQFDTFCTSVYAEGFEDGRESVKGIELEEILSAIRAVKGIGSVRMERITRAVEAVFKGGCKDGDG